MENGTMNGDHHDRSRSPSPGLSRSNSRNACSKEINRTSLLRRNQSLSAKQIRFYRNGDRFFSGLKLAVSPERYKEFDALLAELSNKLDLSTGAVRFIFNAETGKMITDVNELQYGASYVCSSSNCFKEVEAGYGNIKKSWSLANYKKENLQTGSSGANTQIDGSRDFIKPKLVTVIKNGKPPQKKVTMLLNAKTAVNLEQVLDHLSSKGTLGKVDKLHTVDGKQIRELRHLFGDDTMFVALQSNEKFPDEGFDVDVQIPEVRPRWRYAPATEMYSYIPGLRPEPPPPTKTFTVHLHCILAASLSNLTSPRPAPVLRTRSISPRPSSSRKSFTPSPRSSGNFEARRPKTAIGVPSEFSRKSLMPSQASPSLRPTKKRVVPDKPVPIRPIRPKAGSDKPVSIRGGPKSGEQRPLPFQNNLSSDDSDSDEAEGRHGYYIYIYNDKLNKSQGLVDGKPTASVRPMKFSAEERQSDDDDDLNDPIAKLDLKPMKLNLSPADSLETVQA